MDGIYEKIGERIRQAREAKHISQGELAKAMGYQSASTVSYYEAAERKISVLDLHRAATALNVPIEYFLHGEDATEKTQYLRLRAQYVHPAVREAVVDFLLFAQGNASKPTELLQTLHRLGPERASNKLLEGAGISTPPVSPHALCTHLNIPVFEWSFPDDLSGIAVADAGNACVGVNERHARVRQRFSVAHELGHLVLDWEQTYQFDYVGVELAATSDEAAKLERSANWFAADLLMPARWLRRDIRDIGNGQLSEGSLLALSRKYDVSQQSLWFRLLNLKLVGQEEVDTQEIA